jgi:hypothetical protein
VGLFGICSGDAFSWDRQSLLPPLLDLDPTYCQISPPLHISLSELEQVALNFTSIPHPWAGATTWSGDWRDMRWRPPGATRSGGPPARHALAAHRRDMRWRPTGATCAGGPPARHALAANRRDMRWRLNRRDMRWRPTGATCAGGPPARHALVAGTTHGWQRRWRCFDFTASPAFRIVEQP